MCAATADARYPVLIVPTMYRPWRRPSRAPCAEQGPAYCAHVCAALQTGRLGAAGRRECVAAAAARARCVSNFTYSIARRERVVFLVFDARAGSRGAASIEASMDVTTAVMACKPSRLPASCSRARCFWRRTDDLDRAGLASCASRSESDERVLRDASRRRTMMEGKERTTMWSPMTRYLTAPAATARRRAWRGLRRRGHLPASA